MSLLRVIAMCLVAGALSASGAVAQYKTPSGPPGGLPGASMPMPAPMPMPSMPSPSAPTMPAPPAVVVPPPPPPVDRPRDAGGPQECDCYRMVDGRRVFAGKNVACCPR
jgi:hypothetical protein